MFKLMDDTATTKIWLKKYDSVNNIFKTFEDISDCGWNFTRKLDTMNDELQAANFVVSKKTRNGFISRNYANNNKLILPITNTRGLSVDELVIKFEPSTCAYGLLYKVHLKFSPFIHRDISSSIPLFKNAVSDFIDISSKYISTEVIADSDCIGATVEYKGDGKHISEIYSGIISKIGTGPTGHPRAQYRAYVDITTFDK